MSTSKGDTRYTRRYDEAYSEDTESSDGDIPITLYKNIQEWYNANYLVLDELYHIYLRDGRVCFGNSFHQCGDFSHFVAFIYKYMQPGAN